MRVLLVSERGVFLCGNGEGNRLFGISSGDAVAQAGLTKARAVLLAGLVSVEPLALAFRLRSAYPKKRLPIVVLGSLGEISKTEDPSDVRFGDLAVRLRSAYEKPNLSN